MCICTYYDKAFILHGWVELPEIMQNNEVVHTMQSLGIQVNYG